MSHGGEKGKIRTILGYVVIAVIVLLILMWLYAGGWAGIKRAVASLPNPIDIIWGTSTSTYKVNLPWELGIPQGADLSNLTAEGDAQARKNDPSQQLADLQSQYDDLARAAHDPRAQGTPSPYQGLVSLSIGGAQESGPDEYVELDSRTQTPVDVTGWILMSTLDGRHAVIPAAADPFVLGAINPVSSVQLGAGDVALLSTGAAPVGVSFRENMCTGYLAQSQTFSPALENSCPAPSQIIPATEQNLRRYGSDCIDYAQSLPACEAPVRAPSTLSPACRAYLQNLLSYNGCVSANQYRVDFERPTWRLYLGVGTELWNNRHDIIRLLDAQGRTVDAIQY